MREFCYSFAALIFFLHQRQSLCCAVDCCSIVVRAINSFLSRRWHVRSVQPTRQEDMHTNKQTNQLKRNNNSGSYPLEWRQHRTTDTVILEASQSDAAKSIFICAMRTRGAQSPPELLSVSSSSSSLLSCIQHVSFFYLIRLADWMSGRYKLVAKAGPARFISSSLAGSQTS